MTKAELIAYMEARIDVTGRRLTTGVRHRQVEQAIIDELYSRQPVKTAKLFITAAEVQALSTSPKPFGLTVPAGFYVKALAADFMLSGGTTDYTGNTDLVVKTTGATDEQLLRAQALEFDIDIINYMVPDVPTFDANAFSIAPAADFVLTTVTGDPSTGDRDLTVWLTYTLIEA
jgi:hypothetical protein